MTNSALSMIALSLLVFCPCVVIASRIGTRQNSAVGVSAEALVAGNLVLNDRFELVESLWRKDVSSRRLEHAPLSYAVQQRFQDTRELYAGSFGEAWSAVDRQTGQKVVLKMFYTQDPAMPGKTKILTWNMARQLSQQNPKILTDLADAAAECTIAQDLQTKAAQDPVGASRLMRCFEDHVTSGKSTTGHAVRDEDQLYQVLEDCGVQPLSKWIEQNKAVAETNPAQYVAKSTRLFKQMLEGLRYLQLVQYVHHDVKPDNMVVKVQEDGSEILKFIDFGAVTKVSPENAAKSITSSAPFAPPEWFPPSKGFNYDAPWSYDLYQVAVTFDQMMTGTLFYSKLLNRAQWTGSKHRERLEVCSQKMRRDRVPQQQAQRACDREVELEQMDAAKSQATGSEVRLTRHWGKDQVNSVGTATTVKPFAEWGKQEVPKLLELLFGAGQVQRTYDNVARHYKAQALQSDWFPVFMAMIAFDPKKRPTPAHVLESKFLSNVKSVQDLTFRY